MDTLMQSQVFFFISSIGFVLLWALLAMFLFYLIRFMASSSRIMEKLEKDVDGISDATHDMLDEIRDSMVFRFLFGKKKKHR